MENKNYFFYFTGRYNLGNESPINLHYETDMKFQCNIHLYKYPFGDEICQIEVMLKKINFDVFTYEFIKLHGSEISMKFRSLDYKFVRMIDELNNKSDVIKIHMHLQNQYKDLIFTNFIPSCLIYVISYFSFYIPIKNFNERIIVAISSLLSGFVILPRLKYLNESKNYITSVDIWFTGILSFCSINLIVIILLNLMKLITYFPRNKIFQKLEDKEAEMVRENETLNRIWRLNKLARFLFLFIFILFILIFILIVNI